MAIVALRVIVMRKLKVRVTVISDSAWTDQAGETRRVEFLRLNESTGSDHACEAPVFFGQTETLLLSLSPPIYTRSRLLERTASKTRS